MLLFCQILILSSNTAFLFQGNTDSIVNQVYLSELHLNKPSVLNTEISFLDLLSSISAGFVMTSIYDKLNDFDFDIVNFPF